MTQFEVKPLHDSDWHGIHDVFVGDATKMEVIHCKAGPGKTLPPVKTNKTYRYIGEFPAELTPQGMPIFSVHEVEELTS